jgi:hypothetical protein
VRVALFVNAALVIVGAALAMLYVRRRRPLAAAIEDRVGGG